MEKKVKVVVEEYYCNQNLNCAITALHGLSDRYGVELCDQVYDSAIGLNGGGCFGGQCGLLEGPLLFTGILGRSKGWEKPEIVKHCEVLSTDFQNKFGSILCKDLRPGGFSPDDKPHLCKQLCEEALTLAAERIDGFLKEEA